MKKIQLIIVIFLIFYFAVQSRASDTLYVSDSITITLRTGPSTENKIIRSLASGQAVEVLEEQEKWSRVKVTLKNNTETEGWVLKQYLMERIPHEIRAKSLYSENEELKKNLARATKNQESAEKDRKDISSQYSNTLSELTSIKKAYESLKKESAEYLTLKAEYDENLIKLKSAEERLNEVELENDSIKKSQGYFWFGTGALVLLFGMIIGSILGRQSKKRSSTYY